MMDCEGEVGIQDAPATLKLSVAEFWVHSRSQLGLWQNLLNCCCCFFTVYDNSDSESKT